MVENDIWKTNWSPNVQDVHLKSNNMFLKTSSLMNCTNSDNIRMNVRWKNFSDCRMRLMISKFMQYQRLSNWIFPCIVHVTDTTFLIYGMQTLSSSWSSCHFAHVLRAADRKDSNALSAQSINARQLNPFAAEW